MLLTVLLHFSLHTYRKSQHFASFSFQDYNLLKHAWQRAPLEIFILYTRRWPPGLTYFESIIIIEMMYAVTYSKFLCRFRGLKALLLFDISLQFTSLPFSRFPKRYISYASPTPLLIYTFSWRIDLIPPYRLCLAGCVREHLMIYIYRIWMMASVYFPPLRNFGRRHHADIATTRNAFKISYWP